MTTLQPCRSLCRPHQGEAGKKSIEPNISSPAQTESESPVRLTSCGSMTSKPFCPIPNKPAHSARGQFAFGVTLSIRVSEVGRIEL